MSITLVVGAAPVAGEDAFYRDLLAGAAHVVAADGAAEWCVSLGRLPDVAIGDFDSAEQGAPRRLRALGCEVVEHSPDKDETDLDLAVQEALRRFGGPVEITAAFTLRLDHTLAAFGTLLDAGPGAHAVDPGWRATIAMAHRAVTIHLAPGAPFSVLSLGEATGVDIVGARWPLVGSALSPFSGRGISNEAGGGAVTVRCASGALLVIVHDSRRD